MTDDNPYFLKPGFLPDFTTVYPDQIVYLREANPSGGSVLIKYAVGLDGKSLVLLDPRGNIQVIHGQSAYEFWRTFKAENLNKTQDDYYRDITAAVDPATSQAAQNAQDAANAAYAAVGSLPKFRSTTTASPPSPTAQELADNAGLGGSKFGPNGGVISLRWTPHTTAGAWVATSPESATINSVTDAKLAASLANAFVSDTTANPAMPTADQLRVSNAIRGRRVGANGGRVELLWTPHTAQGNWEVQGEETAAYSPFSLPPVSTDGFGVPSIIQGGRTYYPLGVDDLTVEDGVTVTTFRGRRYYRKDAVIDPREFGAAAGTAGNQVDSGVALQRWLNAATPGAVLLLPKEFWSTSQTLILKNITGVKYDWLGVLRPWAAQPGQAQLTDALVRGDGGNRGKVDERYGTVASGNTWGANIDIVRMELDGLFLSRGLHLYMWDHFDIRRVVTHRTRGFAQRYGNMREGVFSGGKIAHCNVTADQDILADPHIGALDFIDYFGGGNDTNNSFKVKDYELVWNLGRMMRVDKMPGDANKPPRLIDFVNLHFEDVPDTGLNFGDPNTKRIQDPRLDRVWIRAGFGYSFTGGIIGVNPKKYSSPAEKEQYMLGSSAIKLGDDTRGDEGRVSLVGFTNLKGFADSGDGAFYKIAKANNIRFDDNLSAPASVRVMYVNTDAGSDARAVRYGSQVLRGASTEEVLTLESSSGGNSSILAASVGGLKGRAYYRNAVGPDGQATSAWVLEAHGNQAAYVLDDKGRLYGDGNSANLILGATAREIKRIINQVQTAPPSGAKAGWTTFADGVLWNPAVKTANKAYPVWFDGTIWRAMDDSGV